MLHGEAAVLEHHRDAGYIIQHTISSGALRGRRTRFVNLLTSYEVTFVRFEGRKLLIGHNACTPKKPNYYGRYKDIKDRTDWVLMSE